MGETKILEKNGQSCNNYYLQEGYNVQFLLNLGSVDLT